MSVAVSAPLSNIVERIDDDYGDDGDDGDDGAVAVSAETMVWMTMPLSLPLIRPGLSYYCANRVHRRCQYPFLTEADNDQLDFLVHQLINEPIPCGGVFNGIFFLFRSSFWHCMLLFFVELKNIT